MTSVAVQSPRPNGADAVPALAMTSGSLTELLTVGLSRGSTVAELVQLVELHDKMSERQARQEFAHAVTQFQAECPAIKKNKTAEVPTKGGGTFSYTYAELDEIARQVNPILQRHGLSYGWDSSATGDKLTCICTLRHISGHSVSSSFTLPTDNNSAASAQQKYGGALTFAQRRTLASVLGLTTTDEDTDASEHDPSTVSEDQVIMLKDLLRETKTSETRFLKWAGVKNLSDVRAGDYESALVFLGERKEKSK